MVILLTKIQQAIYLKCQKITLRNLQIHKYKMSKSLYQIDFLLTYVCITFLTYCSVIFFFKFFYKKKYSISDFRVASMSLVFHFLKFSFSLVLFFVTEKLETKSIVNLIIILTGFYLHNKIIEPRKKFFRLFIFYATALFISLLF